MKRGTRVKRTYKKTRRAKTKKKTFCRAPSPSSPNVATGKLSLPAPPPTF